MYLFTARQYEIVIFLFLVNVVSQSISEVYIDGSKGLRRRTDIGQHFSYANFAAHRFHHLNVTPLVSTSVSELRECGKLCVDHSSCFSFNSAAYLDPEREILCQLLPSDKYNKSSKFRASPTFHHFSIKTPCSSDPCSNNATCVAKYEDNDYHCTCTPGYVGRHCESDINECLSSPCLNGGTCVDGSNMFECNCIAYTTGTRCETIDVAEPVALYPLNAAYNTSDIMGNQPPGVASNVGLAPGPNGTSQGSYQFFGKSDSYIELPNNGGLDTQYSISLCMWVYPDNQTGPLFNFKPSGPGYGVHLWVLRGQLYFHPEKRVWKSLTPLTGGFSSQSQWHYVAVSYDQATGNATMWINGNEVQKINQGVYTLDTVDNVRMGSRDGDNRHFKGRIARVQVYNISLNLEQVVAVKLRGKV